MNDLIGMKDPIERVLQAIRKNSCHHLLILCNRSHKILEQQSLRLAECWLSLEGSHLLSSPDFLQLHCQGKASLHSIQSIRNLIQELSFCPFEGARRVVLIHNAERMLPSASNALLKIFEEPEGEVLFVLTTTEVEKMLPTIRSRSQLVRTSTKSLLEDDQFILKAACLSDFWSQDLQTAQESISTLSKAIDQEVQEERERRKQLIANDIENLPKHLRDDIDSEIEGTVVQLGQERGRKVLEYLWLKYEERILDSGRSCTIHGIFGKTFGKDGAFQEAIKALEAGMSLSSALTVLLKLRS